MRLLMVICFMAASFYAQTPSIEPGVSQELARWRAERYSDVRYKLDLTVEKMSPVLKGTIEVRVVVRRGESGVEGRGDAGGRGDLAEPIILDWRKIRGSEDRSTISNVSINGRVLSPAFRRPASATLGSTGNEEPPKGGTQNMRPPKGGTQNSGTQNVFEESNEHLIFRDGVVEGENVIKLDFTSPILPSGAAITRYIDKEDGSEYIYSLFVPSDASTAFPVFDQPDLKARFSLVMRTPPDWTAIGNNRSVRWGNADVSGGVAGPNPGNGFTFGETLPISTYVFAFAAGPWQQVSEPGAVATGAVGASDSRTLPTKSPLATASGSDPRSSIFVRKSQLAKFQPHAAEVFRLNREAVKYFEDYFDYKFPFPKYDLVLIPEFPFGGMEHAGATFLREAAVIFPQEPTKNDHITRATLIFHEAAHQWFGDTVTMRWFDDLWLKEGFATFTAYKAMERIMPEMNAWKVFYERIKQGAYQTDSTKGTTAIYQPIANLSAAKSAYGNIVYNKAPALLRQTEFYLGEDRFRAGVRSFLKKHEFGNAGWENLVSELADQKNTYVAEFVRPFVTGEGVSIFRFNRNTSGHITLSGDRATSHVSMGTDAIGYTYSENFKRHGESGMDVRLLLRYADENIVEKKRLRPGNGYLMEMPGRVDASRRPRPNFVEPELIFPNFQDYGYGIFLLDQKSRDYVLKNIQNETDPFLRSMMWGALWDSVREGELDPKEYVELTMKNLPLEKDESTAAMILNRVSTAMTYYVSEPPVSGGSDMQRRLETMLIEKMQTAPTVGQRITFYRAFLNIAAGDNARRVLKEILRQQSEPGAVATGVVSDSDSRTPATKSPLATASGSDSRINIPLKTKDRFDIVTRLLILNDPDAQKLLADLEKTETSDDAKRYAYAARAGFATAENKAKYWNDFTTNKDISESWIEAAFGPFNSVRHADLTLPYLERALKELPNHKRNRKIFFVNGWLGAFIGGQRSEEALALVTKFLADNPNLDRDLRLKILENVDVIERAVKIRTKFGT